MKALLTSGLILCYSFAYSQQNYYDVTAGNGYGIRFWQSDTYKIHMGNTPEHLYGPVTDYSIKMNMDVTPGRGWTWGKPGTAPIAAISNSGNMQIAGSFISSKIGIGTSSPAGALDIDAGSGYAIRTRTSSRYVIEVRNTSDVEGGWWLVNDANGDFAIHENGFADRLVVKAGGNMGVGISSPTARLDVSGPSTGYGPTIKASGGGDMLLNDGGSLFFDGNYSYATGNYIRPVLGNTQGFFTSGVERLRITAEGNLGVGTSSPGGKLEIKHAGGQLKLTGGTVAAGVWTSNADQLYLADWNTGTRGLSINLTSGNVGIGTFSPNEKLTVNGTIYGKEIKVDLSVPGPDYVFEKDYNLSSLQDLEKFIAKYKHLPETPSAMEMESNGIELGVMNMLLLKKIEELTLYVIQLEKQNRKQDEVILQLQNK